MSQAIALEVTCSQGHLLRAPQRAIGKTLPCPICRVMVTVKPRQSMSESGALRIMNERIAEIAAKHQAIAAPATRDGLSDTGVMRILGDCLPPVAPPETVENHSSRPCPKCSHNVPESMSVCKNCSCYLGPSPDYFREITNHASAPSSAPPDPSARPSLEQGQRV